MLETIKKRFSVRNYNDKKISDVDLHAIFEAIQYAPTWKNKQCFEVIAINDRNLLKKIGEASRHNPSESAYEEASHLLVFVGDPTKSGLRDGKPYYMSDCAIAMEHASLSATQLGIGSCWVCVFPEEEIKELLHIPEHLRIVGFMSLGYSNESYQARPRRALDEIIHYQQYKK